MDVKKVIWTVCLAAGTAAAQFSYLPPPTYCGVVRDYARTILSSTNRATVIVRQADASRRLLAQGATFNLTDGVNYAVTVPMLSASSTEVVGAVYGSSVAFEVDDGTLIWASFPEQTVTNSGVVRFDLELMTDADGDGVADEYAALIAAYLAQYGLTGPFRPDADYNHDGISNREHYLAGTNPFAGLPAGGGTTGVSSSLTIASMMNVRSAATEEAFAISFNGIADRDYSVLALDDLTQSWGNATPVKSSLTAGGMLFESFSPEATGPMTLFIPKGDKPQRFYRLRME